MIIDMQSLYYSFEEVKARFGTTSKQGVMYILGQLLDGPKIYKFGERRYLLLKTEVDAFFDKYPDGKAPRHARRMA